MGLIQVCHKSYVTSGRNMGLIQVCHKSYVTSGLKPKSSAPSICVIYTLDITINTNWSRFAVYVPHCMVAQTVERLLTIHTMRTTKSISEKLPQ